MGDEEVPDDVERNKVKLNRFEIPEEVHKGVYGSSICFSHGTRDPLSAGRTSKEWKIKKKGKLSSLDATPPPDSATK